MATTLPLDPLVFCSAWLSVVAHARGEPPKIAVVGAIRDKWLKLDASGGPLRQPLTNEQPTFDGVGRWQQFQGGIISWHPATGAYSVRGPIGELWLRLGREKFGYPITDETPTPNHRGSFNHFRALHLPKDPDGSIYFSKSGGAHAIYGAIRERWAKLGREAGKLGFPTSDEHAVQGAVDGSRRVDFERGDITWSPKKGPRESFLATF
jgi:uncharacterized protein with LGFP repeats